MAAPVVDAISSTQFIGNTTTASWSHTCSGTNRYLTVEVGLDRQFGSQVTSTLTYNGVSMTLVGTRQATGTANQALNGTIEVWALIAPASGSNTIAWAGNSGGAADVCAVSISFSDVNQSTPRGTASVAGSMNTSTPSLTGIASATGELLVWYSYGQQPGLTYTLGGGQTSQYSRNSSRLQCSTKAGASSASMSYTIDFGEDLGAIAFSLIPVGGGGSATAVVLGSHPTSGAVNAASSNISLSLDATPAADTIVTPHSDHAGSFSPSTLTYTVAGAGAAQTCTFTPTTSGAHSISTTNDQSLTNITPYTYTVTPKVTVRVVDFGDAPIPSLTGIHWTSSDVTDIDTATGVTDRGSAATSDGSAMMTLAIPNSTKTGIASGSVLIKLQKSDGTKVGMAIVAVT